MMLIARYVNCLCTGSISDIVLPKIWTDKSAKLKEMVSDIHDRAFRVLTIHCPITSANYRSRLRYAACFASFFPSLMTQYASNRLWHGRQVGENELGRYWQRAAEKARCDMITV